MFSAALYARTRYLLSIAYETAGAARTPSSLRPLIFMGRMNEANPRAHGVAGDFLLFEM